MSEIMILKLVSNLAFPRTNRLINEKIVVNFMVLAYITCKDEREAKHIAINLLRKRLIACANIFPIKSIYWWQGKIASGTESVIIAKTISKKYKKVEQEVIKLHSYRVPCILRINAVSNKEHEQWLNKEINY